MQVVTVFAPTGEKLGETTLTNADLWTPIPVAFAVFPDKSVLLGHRRLSANGAVLEELTEFQFAQIADINAVGDIVSVYPQFVLRAAATGLTTTTPPDTTPPATTETKPRGVAFGSDRVYVAYPSAVIVLDRQGRMIEKLADRESQPPLTDVRQVVLDRHGFVYVLQRDGPIHLYNPQGRWLHSLLYKGDSLLVGTDGALYVGNAQQTVKFVPLAGGIWARQSSQP